VRVSWHEWQAPAQAPTSPWCVGLVTLWGEANGSTIDNIYLFFIIRDSGVRMEAEEEVTE